MSHGEVVCIDVGELRFFFFFSFKEEVAAGAGELAKHRGASSVSVNDMSSHLLTQWGIRVPGFRSETKEKEMAMRGTVDAAAPSAHRARLDLKAKLQAGDEEA